MVVFGWLQPDGRPVPVPDRQLEPEDVQQPHERRQLRVRPHLLERLNGFLIYFRCRSRLFEAPSSPGAEAMHIAAETHSDAIECRLFVRIVGPAASPPAVSWGAGGIRGHLSQISRGYGTA